MFGVDSVVQNRSPKKEAACGVDPGCLKVIGREENEDIGVCLQSQVI